MRVPTGESWRILHFSPTLFIATAWILLNVQGVLFARALILGTWRKKTDGRTVEENNTVEINTATSRVTKKK